MEKQDRRRFINNGWKVLAGMFVMEAAWGSWDMIRPTDAGAFGGVVNAGMASQFSEGSVKYYPNGRFYIAAFDGQLQALYQKCPHLGCRVPFCELSGQFECPCHGSVYNIKGEYLQGPAPRGLDRFPIRVEGDEVFVDTGELMEGPSQGVLTGPPIALGGCGEVAEEPGEHEETSENIQAPQGSPSPEHANDRPRAPSEDEHSHDDGQEH